jgi:hypothetical protein
MKEELCTVLGTWAVISYIWYLDMKQFIAGEGKKDVWV